MDIMNLAGHFSDNAAVANEPENNTRIDLYNSKIAKHCQRAKNRSVVLKLSTTQTVDKVVLKCSL